MKRRTKISTGLLLLTLSAGAVVGAAGFLHSEKAGALAYQSDVGMNFTFGSTLSVNISSADLIIPDLSAGMYADSNIVNINVDTNSTYGYTVFASVGNSTSYPGSANYEANDLVHTNMTNKFTSLATTDSLDTMVSASTNTWGYASRTSSSAAWSTYSGLPKYTETARQIATTSDSNADPVQFKIAAKADNSQASGTYSNVINFEVVTNPTPVSLYDAYLSAGAVQVNGYFRMQDMTASICNAVTLVPSELQVIDSRDNKVYWIAKLADGNCWMTQNLDLNIDSGVTYTSADTDLVQFNAGGYLTTKGYACSNPDTTTNCTASGEEIQWTPSRSTINATSGTISGWNNTNAYNQPYSMDPGYWYETPNWFYSSNCYTEADGHLCNYMARTHNYANYFSQTQYAGNGAHGHVGNYYAWPASVAINDASSYVDSTYADTSASPQNSICPANWKLPTIAATNTGKNDFYNLMTAYSAYVTSGSERDKKLMAAPLYFVRGGYTNSNNLYYAGCNGRYWSSTVYSSQNAYRLDFRSDGINPTNYDSRYRGRSVRCLVRQP